MASEMNYERNRIYFKPIPEIDPEADIKAVGCAPIVTILIGIGMLVFEKQIVATLFGPGALFHGDSRVMFLGLIAIGIGIAWIGFILFLNSNSRNEAKRYNANRTIVEDKEIDNAIQTYVEANLKSMALKKLGGLDEDLFREIDPIHFGGYYYKSIPTSDSRYPLDIKRGKDGSWRASNYNAVMFFFSADQVYCYQLRFSLLEDNTKQETTDEIFYKDIVSVSTVTDAVEFGEKDSKQPVGYENFKLTTSGGTSIEATIFNMGKVEHSIQGMKNLVRNKKQQS